MKIDIISIFPDYFMPLQLSLVGKAIGSGLVELELHDLRDFAEDRHRSVDDAPFGGGPGMVMTAPVWGKAIDHVLAQGSGDHPPRLIVPSPAGHPLTQADAAGFAVAPWLIFACGRYEGIDARVVEHYSARMPVAEVSIGDYVLAGGEVAALVIIEAAVRLLPGVLGNAASATDDSFAPGRRGRELEGPVYTRPPEWRGIEVPEVLLSGDHAAVQRWRDDASTERTRRMRPELLAPDR